MLGNGFRWSHTHLCRFKGLQTVPHSPLEDLLHLIFVLIDLQTTPTVLVTVLQTTRVCVTECSVTGIHVEQHITSLALIRSNRKCSHASCSCTDAAAAGGEY